MAFYNTLTLVGPSLKSVNQFFSALSNCISATKMTYWPWSWRLFNLFVFWRTSLSSLRYNWINQPSVTWVCGRDDDEWGGVDEDDFFFNNWTNWCRIFLFLSLNLCSNFVLPFHACRSSKNLVFSIARGLCLGVGTGPVKLLWTSDTRCCTWQRCWDNYFSLLCKKHYGNYSGVCHILHKPLSLFVFRE